MNYEFYDDVNYINKYMQDKNIDLFNPYEGYLKGNAFRNEYVPYKDYKVAKLDINNERDELLINIGENGFILHDLNLYLDVYPNDLDALNKFNEYRIRTNDLVTKYERKYGPLMVKSSEGNNMFNWVEKWPWVK